MSIKEFVNRSELAAVLYAYRREFYVVGVFSMVINLLMLTPTIYMLQVYDRVMHSQSELTLLAVSLIALFLFGVMAFAEWARSRLLVHASVKLDERLSTKVFHSTFESHLAAKGSDSSSPFVDLTQMRQFVTGTGVIAFFDVPWVPIYMAVLFILHPLLGVMGCFFALVQASLAFFGHRKTLEPIEQATKAGGKSNAYLQSKLRNAEVLESMGMVGNLIRRWKDGHRDYMARSGAAQELGHRVTAFSKFVRYSQQSLSLGAGALLVIDDQLSAGAMIAANVLMSRALSPIDMLVGTWKGFVTAKSAFKRLDGLVRDYPERTDQHAHADRPSGDIRLEAVTATAKKRGKVILNDISLAVQAGTVTVVLGPSGSGKSTLGRVMAGIWPELTGAVLLDGEPIDSWSRAALGPHIGYLPQDIELFDGTIAENIARFNDIDPDAVIKAAQTTGLHDMILRFPKGYDTPIGEAGGFLSGGQKQRIALARAIYADPSILILDEPNANLDDVGESALAQAVMEMRQRGATVVLITHRTGIVGVADRLIVVRDGRIAMDGPRQQVMAALAKPTSTPPIPQTA